MLEYETTKVHRCSREGDAAYKQPEPRNSRSRFPLNEEFDGTAKLHNGVKSRESGKRITKPKRKTVGTRGSEDALRRDKTGVEKKLRLRFRDGVTLVCAKIGVIPQFEPPPDFGSLVRISLLL